MNSLYGLLAAPTAASALEAAGKTAQAAATPFDMLLKLAMSAGEAESAGDASQQAADEATALEERVGRQLLGLLESLGVADGERLSFRVHSATGQVDVIDDHPAAPAVAASLRANSQLEDDIRRLAELNGLWGGSPFTDEMELQVEVGEGRQSAVLEWR
jgi:hypothetical protein